MLGMAYGGLVQLLAGMWEMYKAPPPPAALHEAAADTYCLLAHS